MLKNLMRIPDAPTDTSQDSGYSLEVAAALLAAQAHLHQRAPTSATYSRAYADLAPCLSHVMSDRQRMFAYWMLAITHLAMDEYARALECTENAMEIATRLKDAHVCAECAYLLAGLLSARCRYHEAAEFGRIALDSLRSLEADHAPVDGGLELQILTDLASYEFMLADFAMSHEHLAEARRCVTNQPEPKLLAATIEWISALLRRWSGEQDAALRSAMAACEVFGASGSPASYARIQLIVADVALDLAATFPGDPPAHARGAFAALAHPYILRSLRLTRDAQDPAGHGIAQLALARFQRICKRSEDNVGLIAGVIHQAEQLQDGALLCQAQTALGDELAEDGQTESALTCYRNAIDAVVHSDVPALGVWPRRALLRAEEYRL